MADTGTTEHHVESPIETWQALARVLNVADPFFENILFLRGFEFSSNAYLLTGENLTIVDPGNDYTGFMELWPLGFKPADIKKIVLTHGHPDHAMGVLEFLRSYLDIGERSGFELVLHGAGPRQFKEVVQEFGCRITEVEGGETLELGRGTWQVINTPGHTVDGICLYHTPSKTAISGDTVLPDAMAEVDKNAGGRLDHYLLSVRSLLSREIENVLPGHGAPVGHVGRQVVEETYEGLLMKIIGAEDGTPWITGATELVQRGLLPEALFCCDKEIAVHPTATKAWELKALCLNDLGRFQEALGIFDRLDELPPQVNDEFFTSIGRGFALMGLGQYQESIQLFDNALQVKPGAKDALVYKGMALYLAGNIDGAMEVEYFKGEFVERFKEELLKKKPGG